MMNRCEAEIDAIRLNLYEETKGLTKEEQSNRLRKKGQELAAQFGFTIIPQLGSTEARRDNRRNHP